MMIRPVADISEMIHELKASCAAAGLEYDCGPGGRIDAAIAIVAEAPGEQEVQQKSPLVGVSGRMLWDVLRKERILRNNVYTTNVVKRKLVSVANSFDVGTKTKIVVSKQEKEHWKHILLQELARLPNIKYIFALGNFALEALTGHSGITHFRGSVYPLVLNGRTIQVVCTMNPAFILREPKMEIVFRFDCRKLTRVISGEFSAPSITCHINPTYTQAMDYIRMLCEYDGPISHDIETLGDETACVGFAHSNDEGMCINWRSQSANHYTLEQERTLRLAIQGLLGDPSKKLVAQNGHYDASWSWFKDRIRVDHYWFDTMLAHHLLYPALPHNLGFITAQYTDYPYYKDERETWKDAGDIDGFWRYNISDCCITRIAALRMLDELREQGLEQFFFNHVMALQPHLVGMTVLGVKCDVDAKQRAADELERGVAVARELCQVKARLATGQDDFEFNPRSHQAVGKLLFDELKLVGRGTSTDAENRTRIRNHPRTSPIAKELITAIDNYAQEAKYFSTYASSTVDADGRMRCDYRQTGVQSAPGRLSSSQTSWGTGLNNQNIPERAKGMFVADEGFEFSYYDMSQIEARIVATLADIPLWMQQFERARLEPGSYDAHCALAGEMFKVPYDQVPKHDRTAEGQPTIRYVAKRCRHGLNYRMAPDRLATTTGLSIIEAERAYRVYHATTPELRQWWDDLVKLVRRDRSITTSLGRRWLLLERFDDTALDSIVAFEPQSINGDWTSSVIYKCHNDPRWPSTARILINVHDANIALNRIEDGELVRSIMKYHAEQPIYINSVKNRLDGIDKPIPLIVPAEMGVSKPDADGIHRWSTIEKIKQVKLEHAA